MKKIVCSIAIIAALGISSSSHTQKLMLAPQALDAITRSDFPIIQGTVIFSTEVFVGVNFIVDLIYAQLGQRVKLG